MPRMNEDSFENYLRGFEPRPPGPLPAGASSRPRRWQLPLALAALILIGIAWSLWEWPAAQRLNPGDTTQQIDSTGNAGGAGVTPVATLGSLNELFRSNSAQFDAQLNEASRRLLPDVQNTGGLLHVLARE